MIRQQYVALREQTRMETSRMLSQKFGFEMPTMEEINEWFSTAPADWFDSDYSKMPVVEEKPVKEKKAKVVKEKKAKVVKEKKAKVVKEKKPKKEKPAKPAPVENKPSMNMPWCGKAVAGCCGALIVNGGLYTQCFKEIGTEATYCKKHETKRPAGNVSDRVTAGVMNFAPPDGKKVKPFSSYMAKNPVTREAIETEAARLGWTIDPAQWEAYVVKRGRPKKNAGARSAAVPDTSDESGNEASGEEKPKKKTQRKKKVVTEKSVSSDLIAAKVKEAEVEEKVEAVVEKVVEEEKVEEKVEEKIEEKVEEEKIEEKVEEEKVEEKVVEEEKVEEKVVEEEKVEEKVEEEKPEKKMYGAFKERSPPTVTPVTIKSDKKEDEAAAMSDLCETEPESESDGEGIDCEEWEFEGVEYAVDDEGNVYDVDSGDKVGIRKEVNGDYELVLVEA